MKKVLGIALISLAISACSTDPCADGYPIENGGSPKITVPEVYGSADGKPVTKLAEIDPNPSCWSP